MLLKPKVLLYIITVVVIIAAIVWEGFMQKWLAEQPNGGENVLRVDLFVIWPVVLTLLAISLFKIFGRKRE